MSFELLDSNFSGSQNTKSIHSCSLLVSLPRAGLPLGGSELCLFFQWNLAFSGPILLLSQISFQLLVLVSGETPFPLFMKSSGMCLFTGQCPL